MNNRQPPRRGRGRNNSNNNNNRNNNRGGSGGVDRDNRIDNRARGNAAQMLDKYKKMAHDAQVNDDRVNAEYYLQFADHYFRVNADTMARREEQRVAREEQRGDRDDQRGNNADRNSGRDNGRDHDDDNDGDDGRKQSGNASSGRGQQRDDRNQGDRSSKTSKREDSSVTVEEKKPVRARRPRKTEAKAVDKPANGDASESNGLDASALPPAISISRDDDEPAEKKPVRKKRVVKPKIAEEGDVT